MNNNRAAFKLCVQKGLGETGKTFSGAAAFILRARPLMAFLENVTDLNEKPDADGDNSESDTDYILRFFKESDFYAFVHHVDAAAFGSPAARLRLYFVIIDRRRLTIQDPTAYNLFVSTVLTHMQSDEVASFKGSR